MHLRRIDVRRQRLRGLVGVDGRDAGVVLVDPVAGQAASGHRGGLEGDRGRRVVAQWCNTQQKIDRVGRFNGGEGCGPNIEQFQARDDGLGSHLRAARCGQHQAAAGTQWEAAQMGAIGVAAFLPQDAIESATEHSAQSGSPDLQGSPIRCSAIRSEGPDPDLRLHRLRSIDHPDQPITLPGACGLVGRRLDRVGPPIPERIDDQLGGFGRQLAGDNECRSLGPPPPVMPCV